MYIWKNTSTPGTLSEQTGKSDKRAYIWIYIKRKGRTDIVICRGSYIQGDTGSNYFLLWLSIKLLWRNAYKSKTNKDEASEKINHGSIKIVHVWYRVFIKYCVFSLKCCDFSELCQFCCSTGFLPAWCVYTHWHRWKTVKGQSPEYLKIFGKKHNI